MAQSGAERNRLINKSLYFAFFSKTTFLYQLSMTTNGIVKYCTQHTVLPQCTSSQLRLHRRVFLHFLSFLIRHTNTLRLNSISVWCKHCVRHLSHKQRYIFWSSLSRRERNLCVNDHLTLVIIPKWTPCLILQHTCYIFYIVLTLLIVYNNKNSSIFCLWAASSQSLSDHTHCNHVRQECMSRTGKSVSGR